MTAYAPAARRRRRWPLRLAITVLVLVGLLVAVDRISVAVAEAAVAQTVQNSQHLANKPSVSIDGFPFLTQLASGHYDKIELSDDDLTVGRSRRTVKLAHLLVTLHDVHVARDFRSGTAGSGTADAKMSYQDLSQTLGTRLTYAGAGRVRASASVNVGGQSVSGAVTATPRLAGNALEFADPHVAVSGADVPAAVSSALAGVFGAPIPLDNLPYLLTVRSLSANQHGVSFTLTAQQLTFRR